MTKYWCVECGLEFESDKYWFECPKCNCITNCDTSQIQL